MFTTLPPIIYRNLVPYRYGLEWNAIIRFKAQIQWECHTNDSFGCLLVERLDTSTRLLFQFFGNNHNYNDSENWQRHYAISLLLTFKNFWKSRFFLKRLPIWINLTGYPNIILNSMKNMGALSLQCTCIVNAMLLKKVDTT